MKKDGSDAHNTTEAQVAATAWLTIDKAANEVVAGDTVVVGAGVYREQVTMDTPGTSVAQITFVADVDGALGSGDPGLVIISAYADETSVATRASCVDPNELDFITWRGFTMTGGTSGVVYKSGSGNVNYEGCVYEDCVFISGHADTDYALVFNFNQGTSPTSNGITIRRCVAYGGAIRFAFDMNGTAEQDMKVSIESCLFTGSPGLGTSSAGVLFDYGLTGTYSPGGVSVDNCTFVGKFNGVVVDHNTSTTYPVTVTNSAFVSCYSALSKGTSNDGALTGDYNTFAAVTIPLTNVTAGGNDRANTSDPGLIGGIGDYPLTRFWGWSPYRPWEPIRLQDDSYVHAVIGAGDAAVAPAFDLYNEPRPMAGRAGERTDIYHFDASDAGPTDNDAAWTDDGQAFDGDEATLASTTTPGTQTTDELRGEGTNAPITGGTIIDVEWRAYFGSTTGDSCQIVIQTDAGAQNLANAALGFDDAWSSWSSLATPSGGWTWVKAAALEIILFANSSATLIEIGVIQIRVTSTPDGDDDQGAVEGRARPEQETTTVADGTNAVRFEGAGFHDFFIPVAAVSTTVTVKAQRDSNYAGTLPQILLMGGAGLGEGTPDTVVTAAGTWDDLSINFTPTEVGIVRVRIRSNDTSATGEAFFDTFTVG